MQLKGLNLKIKRFKNSPLELKKWMRLVACVLLVIALILAAFFLANSILSNPNIYTGVYIDGYHVGGMSPSALHNFIREQYETCLDEVNLVFFTESFERVLSFEEAGISVNTESMEEQALMTGRRGFFLTRLMDISRLKKNPVHIPLTLHVDEEQLNTVIEDLNRYFKEDVTVPKVILSSDQAVLCTGESGWEVDTQLLRNKLLDCINDIKTSYIHIPLKELFPPKIDIDSVYEAILQEPVDAVIVKLENGTAGIQPQVNGRTIDKNELRQLITRVEERGLKIYEEVPIPIEVTEPEVKTRELEALLFRDLLSTASTSFNTNTVNNRNRGINIRLAAGSIDGTTVFPGEEFSFNEIVGPRTPQKGYVIAHIFSAGQVKDGYGGGICQVSTTLYDAALLANLSVTERHNHMFTVGYVPLGLDAAVSYGYADLKFKNTTDYPVRINAQVSDSNVLSFSITGTNLYPGVKVRMISEIVSVTKATTQYIDDPLMAEGLEIVVDKGMDGAVADTYIQIYNGNDLIKDYKLHQSIYQMLPRKVRRGTKKIELPKYTETE